MSVKKRGLFLVVLSLFLIVFLTTFSPAEVSGCYVYPGASEDLYCVEGVLDTEAQADCETYPDCNLDEHFIPGSDCSPSILPECEEFVCNVDCQLHARGKCEQLDGQPVPDEDYTLWCTPGCCKIADKFCQFNLLKYQCLDKAEKLGYQDPTSIIFDNSLGMDTAKCNQQYCQVEVKKAGLTVFVADEEDKALAGVKLVLEGTTLEGTTSQEGMYTFPSLNPGTYSLKATLEGYSSGSLIVSLAPEETAEHSLILQKLEGVAEVKGTVLDEESKPITGATVSWSGPVESSVKTDEFGNYQAPNLPEGDYTFTASQVGYKPETKIISITAIGTFPLNFELKKAALQGISGTVYLDVNNNKGFDSGDLLRYDAKIYIDGVFKGRSQYPDGNFAVEVEVTVEEGREGHTISASYLNYEFAEETFELGKGEAIENKVLLLTVYIGECTEPGTEKDVEEFSALPVPGKEEVRLEWTKPCPEVIGYEIKKFKGGEELESLPASPAENFLLDSNVEWGEEYTYKIIVYYDKNRLVESALEVSVNVGNGLCEDRYDELTGWEVFCLTGDKEIRKKIWTCNDLNQLGTSQDCSEKDAPGEDYYCAQITSGIAECKDAGGCGILSQAADPFGLYYNRQSCYGTSSPEEGVESYCYYDYTNTIVDECRDCTQIENCFDYRSKDACEINNCLGTKCNWVNGAAGSPLVDYSLIDLPLLVTSETGAGYCVEEDYQGEEFCSLCAPTSTLFENFYCTADVCSGLGRCFSAFELDQCNSCGENPSKFKNCYYYSTELECTGGEDVNKNIQGEISLSEDRCGWGRCLWKGLPDSFSKNGCVKDGDADGEDDCSSFANAGERNACKIDNSPPRTKTDPEGINIISLAQPELTFIGDDTFHAHGGQKNKMGVLGYCLVSADSQAQSVCSKDDFVERPYPGKDDLEEVTVNLIESPFLQGRKINGQTYRLKFYSKDKYRNQENLRGAFVYVDNVPPEFEIREEIETTVDITTLKVYLEGTSDEIMACTFTLEQLLPAGDKKEITVPREVQEKEATFENLEAVKVAINVTCTDDQGNVNSKVKPYTFDLEQNIDLVYPELFGVVSETEIAFKVNTAVGATCSLHLAANNEKVADFVSNEEGKVHETSSVPGFIEKEYAGEYKVFCKELFTDQTYEDYYHFTVDFTPPKAQVILQEDSRIEEPAVYGWEEFFIEHVSVDFECVAEGFACEEVFYCLGDGCEIITSGNYQEYSSTIELTESTKICYYATDTANNPVFQPLCGEVKIEGYGITLEKPELHYYLDEQWGISNKPLFDWQFYTKVPTTECKFEFSPEFDYNIIPPHKTREVNSEDKYLFENFPESVFTSYAEDCSGKECIKEVYVKCKNFEGETGPEQKIHLEYDHTAPEIIKAFADPDKIFDGITTQVFVDTDDKTLCKYSEVSSEGSGSFEYENMEFSFPGNEENILNVNHQDIFKINFLGPSKNYTLAAQCRNGAGNLTDVKNITFLVNYAEKGYIIEGSLSPSGYVWVTDVTLSVQTSKNAYCSYDFNGTGYVPFAEGKNSKLHTAELTGLVEGEYSIPVKCAMGDHLNYAKISFALDFTPPVINEVDDGNHTCGNDGVKVMVYASEESIDSYAYEVYDADGIAGTLIASGEVGPELPIEIPTAELAEGSKYKIKVRATDLAGNQGEFKESDGVMVVGENYSACELDGSAPLIEVSTDKTSCTKTTAELICNDNIGCKKILYGKSGTASQCETVENYNGEKILFEQTGWLCYYVVDYKGNNHSDIVKVTFVDEDGDGIADDCDECTETTAGAIVNEKGCADGDVPESEKDLDTDGDGLPDYWENNYDAFDCPLDFANTDSDDNGIFDNVDDYDGDGYGNYEEYVRGFNPCLADAVVEEEVVEEIKPPPAVPKKEKPNFLAIIFLVLGLLMVIGGIGYLIYYYKYSPAAKVAARPAARPAVAGIAAKPAEKPGIVQAWKEKLLRLRKSREKKLKERKREEVFEEFGKESKEIPHVEAVLHKKAPHLSRLQELASKYTEHKEEIKPGLRKDEKSVFNRLEKISGKAKGKKIAEVVTKGEAKDIFSKLNDISKKRKEEK